MSKIEYDSTKYYDPLKLPEETRGRYLQDRTKVMADMRSNEMVVRRAELMQRRLESGVSNKIRTPADAIGERGLLVGAMMCTPNAFAQKDFDNTSGYSDDVVHMLMLWATSQIMRRAPIFIWRHKPREASKAMTLPDHVFGADGWPYDLMWWTFEGSLMIQGSEGNCEGVILLKTETGVEIVALRDYGENQEGPMGFTSLSIPFGDRITEGHPAGDFLKMISFLNSKYVSSAKRRMVRAERRALVRAGKIKESEEAVHVVDLRAADQSSKHDQKEGDGRDWEFRWWVRGHIRAQWCPSSKSHKLIWIAPYLKGPEEKPIATRVYNVMR